MDCRKTMFLPWSRFFSLALQVICMLFFVFSSPVARAQIADRVLQSVNPRQVIQLSGHHPAWANPQNNAGAVDANLPMEHLAVVLARSPQQQQAFEQFLRDQQDPASSAYHHWLTPTELGERFGVSLHDIAAVTGWLRSRGLTVDSVSNSRARIAFSGPASAVGNAFGTELRNYEVNGKQDISVSTEPRIPAAIAPVVRSVHGLYTIEAHPMHVQKAGLATRPTDASPEFVTSEGRHNLSPADFATIYGLNPVYARGIYGNGQAIAIIGRDRVNDQDIYNFQKVTGVSFNYPIVIVPPAGVDPGAAATSPTDSLPSSQAEATLDVTRAGVSPLAPLSTWW